MTAVAIILAVAFLAASVLCVILGVAYDRRGDVIEGLRDQLHAESKAAKHWYGVARGYHDAPGTRTSEPRAREVVWTTRDMGGAS